MIATYWLRPGTGPHSAVSILSQGCRAQHTSCTLLQSSMHSPSLEAGTGMLQEDQIERGSDIDLNAIDEILSQHSNQKPFAHPASQAASSGGSPAVVGIPIQDQTDDAAKFQSLVPAGPDNSDVIDLACIPEPAPKRSSLTKVTRLHPRATRIASELPLQTPTSSKPQEADASHQQGTSNR